MLQMNYIDNIVSQETCLSPGVLSLCQLGIASTTLNILMPDGTLKWECIKNLLDFKAQYVKKSENWYKAAVAKLAPVVAHVLESYKMMHPTDFEKTFSDYLLWTHNHQVFLHCFELLHQESEIAGSLAMLLLTASIERSLGNVYLLKGSQVPSLLKDLLSEPQLSEIFGAEVIDALQVIIGPPFSLNLRNLLWHGFLAPSELDKQYGYFLLIIIVSLGKRLEMKGISVSQIPCREAVTFSQTSIWEGIFPCVDNDNIPVLKEIFYHSAIVLSQMKPYWGNALEMIMEKKYGESLAVMLPQLENCLRVIFVSANNCQRRLLTAESTALYTTFDEILDEYINVNEKNAVRDILGNNYMELLFDMLVHPEGPRIRDRLSHGEADFYDLPCILANHVLSTAAVLCCKFVPENRSFLQNNYVKQLLDCADSYQPCFHPAALLKKKSVSFIERLADWYHCPFPEEISLDVQNCLSSYLSHSQISVCIDAVVCYYHLEFLGTELAYCPANLNKVQEFMKKWNRYTVYRPRLEVEVTTLLRQICHHAFIAVEHVYNTLCCRYELWKERKLRSRQRSNYVRLLCSKETIGSGLYIIALIIVAHFCYLSKVSLLSNKTKDIIIRILKGVLQYVENVNSLTHPDKNRFEETVKMTADFITSTTNHCKKSSVFQELLPITFCEESR